MKKLHNAHIRANKCKSQATKDMRGIYPTRIVKPSLFIRECRLRSDIEFSKLPIKGSKILGKK